MSSNFYDIVIVGSGPVGLNAAIEAKRQGLSALVLDKGVLCDAIYNWPTHIRFFTTAKLLEIGGHPFPSTDVKPTRQRALDYYRGVAENEQLNVLQHHRVVDITRNDHDFTISGEKTLKGKSEAFEFHASNVIVAIGYFDNPNGLGGVPGEDKPLVSYYFDEPHPYYDHDVVIIGAGNSGAETALALWRHGAHVTVVHKYAEPKESIKYWLRTDFVNRLKEGSITPVMSADTKKIVDDGVIVDTPDEKDKFIPADQVFILTGYEPDVSLLQHWGMEINPEDKSVKKDDNTHETTNPGMYVVGSCGAGQNTSTIFIENGRIEAVEAVQAIANHRNSINQRKELLN